MGAMGTHVAAGNTTNMGLSSAPAPPMTARHEAAAGVRGAHVATSNTTSVGWTSAQAPPMMTARPATTANQGGALGGVEDARMVELRTATLRLEQENRKAFMTAVRATIPWAMALAQTLGLRGIKMHEYFTTSAGRASRFSSLGTMEAMQDLLQVVQDMAMGIPSAEGELRYFQPNSGMVCGVVFARFGGPIPFSDPLLALACVVQDFVPMVPGQAQHLMNADATLYSKAPGGTGRKATFASMEEWREAAETFAYLLGLFVDPRLPYMLEKTIDYWYNHHQLYPNNLTPDMAMILINKLVSEYCENGYRVAMGMPLRDMGTVAYSPADVAYLRSRGLAAAGFTAIVPMECEWMRRNHEAPIRSALMATAPVTKHALQLMGGGVVSGGGERSKSKGPPTGGASGASGMEDETDPGKTGNPT